MRDRFAQRKLMLAVAAALSLSSMAWAGTVSTDGSLGTARNLTGPTFSVTPELGKRVGSNLFHSLKKLDLDAGETASFSGPSGVRNVLTRVTGGASTINGTLQCTIPNANFFLMNKAGVVFGPNAALDVQGAFVVTTADYLKLSDGKKFGDPGPDDALLTSASPAAFGFLGNSSSSVTMNGGTLAVSPGKVLTVVGGSIQASEMTLSASKGRINLIAVKSGEVQLDAESLSQAIDVSLILERADIKLETETFLMSLDAYGGGRIDVVGADMQMKGASLAAGSGEFASRGVRIDATGDLVAKSSSISTSTSNENDAGSIEIEARTITFNDFRAEASAIGFGGPTGMPGKVYLTADSIDVVEGQAIFSVGSGPNPPRENLVINTPQLLRDGKPGRVTPDRNWYGFKVTIAGFVATDGATGEAVTIDGPEYMIPSTLGRQSGGNLFLSLSQFDIGEDETAHFTGPNSIQRIIARVTDSKPSSWQGAVNVDIDGADLIVVNRQGIWLSKTAAFQSTGSLTLTSADRLRFDDGKTLNSIGAIGELSLGAPVGFGFLADHPGFVTSRNYPPTGVYTFIPDPIAGGIAVQNTTLTLSPEKSFTFIGGPVVFGGVKLNAPRGDIRLTGAASPGEVTLSGAGVSAAVDLSGIATRAPIMVDGDRESETLNGKLSAPGGGIVIHGRYVSIQNWLWTRGEEFGQAGGRVTIDASEEINMQSFIWVDVSGSGEGGTILVRAPKIYSASTFFNAFSETANGGSISIFADQLTLEMGSSFSPFALAGEFNTFAARGFTPGPIRIEANTIYAASNSEQIFATFDAGAQADTPLGYFPGGRSRVTISGVARTTGTNELLQPIINDRGSGSFYIGKGDVTLDGSLSAAQSIAGPFYEINSEMGRRAGNNLFHSFGQLSLSAGEVMTFHGPSEVRTIVARVTGASSSIEGTIATDIPNANLVLINPAGWVIGQRGTLALDGSLVLSTAKAIGFDGGVVFPATNTPADLLSAAPIRSFEFDGNIKPSLQFAGRIESTNGSVNLIANAMTFTTRDETPSNILGPRISLVAVESGSLNWNPLSSQSLDPSTVANRGDISLDSTLRAGSSGIQIVARNATLSGALNTDPIADETRGGDITVDASTVLKLSGVTIQSNAEFAGSQSGAISLRADRIDIDSRKAPVTLSANATADAQYAADMGITLSATADTLENFSVFLQKDGIGMLIFSTFEVFGSDLNNVTFDDAGSIPIYQATLPYAGTYRPSAPFTNFNGTPASGTWTLLPTDEYGNSNGTLQAWSLRLGNHTFSAAGLPATIGDYSAPTQFAINVNLPGESVGFRLVKSPSVPGSIRLNAASAISVYGTPTISASSVSANVPAGTAIAQAPSITINGLRGLPVSLDELSAGSFSFIAHGALSLDSTLSSARTLSGPDYQVSESDGALRGSNLFFSFSSFQLAENETLTFAGPDTVTRIISRVTGSNPAAIDGTVRSGIAGADWYLISPQGISLGKNAALDVSGSVLFTTADSLGFADGKRFDASNPPASSLGGAKVNQAIFRASAPAAFGFVGQLPEFLERSQFSLSAGKSFSVVSGPINLDAATVTSPAGQINLLAVGSAGNVQFSPDSASAAVTLSGFSGMADIRLTDSQLRVNAFEFTDVFDAQAGAFDIQGQSLDMVESRFISSNGGAAPAGRFDVSLTHNLTMFGASDFYSAANQTGRGATINVRAGGAISIDSNNKIHGVENYGVLATTSGTTSVGGDVSIEAGTILLQRGAALGALNNSSTGSAGNVSVQADEVVLDGRKATAVTVIASQTQSEFGDAGDILLNVGKLTIYDGGSISGSTFGKGNAGNVTINADSIVTETTGKFVFSGITSSAAPGSEGDGGSVTINARSISMSGGGCDFSTGTFGPGAGGNLTVNVDQLLIDAKGSQRITGLVVQSNPGLSVFPVEVTLGASGNAIVNAKSIHLTGGGQISGSTYGNGVGGSVLVTADSILIDGANSYPDPGVTTSIRADTLAPQNAGNGGDVEVVAGSIQLLNNGKISAASFGPGQSGRVSVQVAGELSIASSAGISTSAIEAGNAGNVSVSAGSLKLASNGSIESSSDKSNAGTLAVTANGEIDLKSGAKFSVAALAGTGGSLSVSADRISLDASTISAQAKVAGQIAVDSPTLTLKNGSLITSDTVETFNNTPASVRLRADALMIDASTVRAETTGTGVGGSVSLSSLSDGASAIQLLNDSTLSASTTAAGKGGDVSLSAQQVSVDHSRVLSESTGSGDGGNVIVQSPALAIQNQSLISTSTASSGKGGSATLRVGELTLSNSNVLSETTGVGPGGSVEIALIDGTSGRVRVVAGAIVSASTRGAGTGGELSIAATDFVLDGAKLLSESTGSGQAGRISASVSGKLTIQNDANVSASAANSLAGNISLSAGDLSVDHSTITTFSGAQGGNVNLASNLDLTLSFATLSAEAVNEGNIKLTAPRTVSVLASTITARAENQGGQISIDPELVVLEKSTINGLGGGRDVEVIIVTDTLIVSSDSDILTSRRSFTIETDFLNALQRLPETRPGIDIGLLDRCGTRLGGSASTFVVIGRGAMPMAPGALLLSPPTSSEDAKDAR